MPNRRTRRRLAPWPGLLLAVLLAFPGASLAQVAQEPESNEALFDLARGMFNSASQPDSIALFSRLIARLELAGDPAGLTPTDRQLLAESLYYRASASLNIGDEPVVRADLLRLLSFAPDYSIDRQLVSPKLAELFDGARAEIVGDLQLSVSPPDARVFLDEAPVDNVYGLTAMVAGPHTLRVERPGFAPEMRELDIVPAELNTTTVELQRVSAVLRLYSRPTGSSVRLDGADQGRTSGQAPRELVLRGEGARYPNSEFSAALLVEGVAEGRHTLEVTAEGYRTRRVEVDVTGLEDFDLGGVVLEPLSGTIALAALPGDASVTIDGRASRLTPRAVGTETLPAVDLSPGIHIVTVTGAAGNVFEAEVEVRDAETARVDVDMRPSIAFLGVLGEDEVGAQTVRDTLAAGLDAAPEWSFLDRSGTNGALLSGAGLDTQALRDLGQLSSVHAGGVSWPEAQQFVAERARGSVYLLAVLSDDLLATHVDLWLWPAPPGPATPDRVRLPLDDRASLEEFVQSLRRPFVGTTPWFGAVLVDTDGAQGPIVFDISANGPAARAGIQAGDAIVSVGRDTAAGAAQVRGLLAQRTDGAPVEVIVLRNGATTRTSVEMEDGPSVIPGGLPTMAYSAVWAASLAQLDDPEATLPRWVAELNLANVLMQAGYWDDAVRRLRGIRVPDDSSFAGPMVDYLMGVALEAVGPQYLELARDAYSRAAAAAGARLWHRDGPYLVPRARARLATLGGASQ